MVDNVLDLFSKYFADLSKGVVLALAVGVMTNKVNDITAAGYWRGCSVFFAYRWLFENDKG